jgi:hypothetical protein
MFPTADALTQQWMSCICKGRHEIFRMRVHGAAYRHGLLCKHWHQLGLVGLHTVLCVEDTVNKRTPGMMGKTFTLLQLGTISWVVNITVMHCEFAQRRKSQSINSKSMGHRSKGSP